MLFRLLIDFEAVAILDGLSPRRRQKIFHHLRQIQDYPGSYSIDIHMDPDGRRLDVSIYDGLTIHYWTDIADRHVKILRVLTNE